MLLADNVLDAETEFTQSGLGNVLLANVEHGIVESAAHEEFEREVVDALAVGKCLALLGLVPLQNQAVTEGQARGGIGCGFVAVEHAAGQCRLDVSNDFILEAVLASKGLDLVFGPCCTLGLWDGGYRTVSWSAKGGLFFFFFFYT